MPDGVSEAALSASPRGYGPVGCASRMSTCPVRTGLLTLECHCSSRKLSYSPFIRSQKDR